MFCTSASELSSFRVSAPMTSRDAISDFMMNRIGTLQSDAAHGVFCSTLFTNSAAVAQAAHTSRSFHAWASRVALQAEIRSFGKLADDWDGEGAIPVSGQAIEAAAQFIELMAGTMSPPLAYPNPNGTITLAWRWRVGRAELEIGKTRHSWIVVDRSPGNCKRTSCSGDNSRVPELGLSDLAKAIANSTSADPLTTVAVSMRHTWEEAA